MLVIHTNFGPLLYNLKGNGVENPYRVKPILSHKLPVDVDYRRPISIYNPYSETLKIKEIFTTEGFLLLSLPDISVQQAKNGPGRLWEIPPHQTKTVIYLDFQSKQSGKYQGFIHIQTEKDNLIVHVEFVVSKSGVHSVVDEIDFGTLISPTERRSREIILLNSSPLPVLITEVFSQNPDPQLKIEFDKGTTLQEGALTTVATITYNGHLEGKFHGKILFKTNDTNPASTRIEVPYRSRVIHGNLDYYVNGTAFFVGSNSPIVHSLKVVNYFSMPMQLRSAEIDDTSFQVLDFVPGSVLDVKSKKVILSIKFQTNDTSLIYKSNLILETNVTKLFIPLYCFHGKLTYLPYRYSKSKYDKMLSVFDEELRVEEYGDKGLKRLNFGILGVGEKKTHFFFIKNMNPVAIPILEWSSVVGEEKSIMSISLDKIYETENTTLSLSSSTKATALTDEDDFIFSPPKSRRRQQKKKKDYILMLKPGYKALIRLDIIPTKESVEKGEIRIKTSYSTLVIPYQFICSSGTVKFPGGIDFGEAYPGRIIKKGIFATSTVKETIKITKITSSDKRFIPGINNKLVVPDQKTRIGFVFFDASQNDENLAGEGKISNTISESDVRDYKKRSALFSRGSNKISIFSELVIYSNAQKRYHVNITATLTKPKLSVSKVDFTLVHLGASAIHFIRVTNPTDHPIRVRLILGGNNFTLVHDDQFKLHEPSRGLVPPHKYVDFGPLMFTPQNKDISTCELYVKNNLTVFDIVHIKGEGGIGRLAFKNDGKIEEKMIHWKIPDDEIGILDNGVFNLTHPRNSEKYLVFTRRFVLQNIGNLPVVIQGATLDGYGCEAYGVRIVDCGAMTLNPNEERPFVVEFTPDFTTSRVNLLLVIETRAGRYRFPMIVDMPYHFLQYLYGTQPVTFNSYVLRIFCTFILFGIGICMIWHFWDEFKWVPLEKHLPILELAPKIVSLPILSSPKQSSPSKTKKPKPPKKKKSLKDIKVEIPTEEVPQVVDESDLEQPEILEPKEEEDLQESQPESDHSSVEEYVDEKPLVTPEPEKQPVIEEPKIEFKAEVVNKVELKRVEKKEVKVKQTEQLPPFKKVDQELLKLPKTLPFEIDTTPKKIKPISKYSQFDPHEERRSSEHEFYSGSFEGDIEYTTPRYKFDFGRDESSSPSIVFNRLTQNLKPQIKSHYFSLFKQPDPTPRGEGTDTEYEDESEAEGFDEYTNEQNSNSFFTMDMLLEEELIEKRSVEAFKSIQGGNSTVKKSGKHEKEDMSNLPEFFRN